MATLGREVPLPTGATSSDVEREILDAQDRILRAEGVRFSATPVIITAVSPGVTTEMILVDLPGLVADEEGPAVKRIVRAHLENPGTLIAAAGKTENEDKTDIGISFAKEIDTTGERTIRLYTFFREAQDVMQQDALATMRACSGQSNCPHILDLRREGDKLVEALPIAGAEASMQGIQSFLVRCAEKLGPMVSDAKSQMLDELETAHQQIEERLRVIGRAPPTDADLREKLEPMLRMLRNRIAAVTGEEGCAKSNRNINTALRVLKGRLGELGADTITEEDNNWWALNDLETTSFQGRKELGSLVYRTMTKWEAPIEAFIKHYKGIYIAALLDTPADSAGSANARSADANPRAAPPPSALAAAAPEPIDLFNILDANGDGIVEREELRHYLEQQAAMGKTLTDLADGLFHLMDANLDGELHADEIRDGSLQLPRTIFDRYNIPPKVCELVLQKFSALVKQQARALSHKMLPQEDHDGSSELEKMMEHPPAPPVDAWSRIREAREPEALKEDIRKLPQWAMDELRSRYQQFDPGSEDDLPEIVMQVMETRKKIKIEAEHWVGKMVHGIPTGRMQDVWTKVRDEVRVFNKELVDFKERFLRDEATMNEVRNCFELTHGKASKQRSDLLRQENIVTEMKRLLLEL